jgi:hypothetical protein
LDRCVLQNESSGVSPELFYLAQLVSRVTGRALGFYLREQQQASSRRLDSFMRVTRAMALVGNHKQCLAARCNARTPTR